MTREEKEKLIRHLKYNREIGADYLITDEDTDEIIKALEQEPCEDAISRQAAQAKIKSICDEYRLSYEDGERKAATGGSAYALGHAFDDLPPVTPQPKIGHWILTSDDDCEYCTCSECGYQNGENWMIGSVIKFCQECGAKMVEPQEREDKE